MTEIALISEHAGPDGTTPIVVDAALESCKEIAAYLNRDVRTVARSGEPENLPLTRRIEVAAYPSGEPIFPRR